MLQKPIVFARSPWPLPVRVHRPPLRSSPFVLKNIQVPCSVITEYCKAMHVQTLPEEFFLCANLQPDRKHGVCSQGSGSSVRLGHQRRTQQERHGRPSSCRLTYRYFPPIPQRKGEELSQSCKRDRKKKKVTFPQNLITHNSCIQVCVSSKST